MIKTIKIAFFLMLVLAAQSVLAQGNKWEKSGELGFAVGTAYYIGDINPYKHFGGELKLGGGILYRQCFNRRWGVKSFLGYHTVSASDAESDNPWQQNRNLNFESTIIEGSVQAEFNFLPYQIGHKDYIASPYLFAGIGVFKMNPMAELNGFDFELQPLGTEGQGTTVGENPYSLTSVALPFGIGFRCNLSKSIAVSLEWGMRKTYTDYLDDVSTNYVDTDILVLEKGAISAALADPSIGGSSAGEQRGDPGRKDWYNFSQLMITIKVGEKPTTCWK